MAHYTGTEYHAKLLEFAEKVQDEQQAQLKIDGRDCEANMVNVQTHIKVGKKYDKVNIGHSGRFMVEQSTGRIFGIKGYGKIHRGHAYGELNTISEWYWGGYSPVLAELRPIRI